MPATVARQPSDGEKPPVLPELPSSGVLGASVSIKGSVVSDHDLFVDGEVEGSIEAIRSTVTVGPNAKLAASIAARNIVVFGSVQGPVTALDSIELRSACSLVGDVMTSRIVIEDGAYFKGSIDISQRKRQIQSSSEAVALEERYSKLVDLKYLRGLTKPEEAEFESLSSKLASLDASFYEPVLERLAHSGQARENIGASLRAR